LCASSGDALLKQQKSSKQEQLVSNSLATPEQSGLQTISFGTAENIEQQKQASPLSLFECMHQRSALILHRIQFSSEKPVHNLVVYLEHTLHERIVHMAFIALSVLGQDLLLLRPFGYCLSFCNGSILCKTLLKMMASVFSEVQVRLWEWDTLKILA